MKLGKLKKMVKITDPLEMVGFIKTNGTQCQFVSMLTVTEPKLKKSCPYVGVTKVSRRNGLINMNYNTAVLKRIAASIGQPISEVSYENGAVWFEHIKDGEGKALPLVQHAKTPNGFYLQYFPLKSKDSYQLSNGEPITEDKLKPFFYARKESDYKPITCVFKMDNIKELRAAGFIIQTDEVPVVESILQS
jgi:hypothetical protein